MDDSREIESNNYNNDQITPVQSKEDKLYRTSLKKGIVSSVIDLLIYGVIPYVAITLIKSNYPDLDPTGLDQMIVWTLILGPIIAILSFFEAYYYPGHKGRLVSGIIGTFAIGVWVYMVFGGTTIKSTYADYDFFVDITGLIWLAIFGVSLKSVYRIMEYLTHSKILRNRASTPIQSSEDVDSNNEPLPPPPPPSSSHPIPPPLPPPPPQE